MSHPKLLGLSGSLRAASFNRKLLNEAVRLFGDATYQEGNLRLPLYDGDLEDQGLPEQVQELSDQIAAADAVIIATPEYNKSLSGVLKNALDWISRTKGNPWEDKPLALLSATAGRTGGEAAQYALRLAMISFRPKIMPGPAVMVAGAAGAFDDDGRLSNERYADTLGALMDKLRAAL